MLLELFLSRLLPGASEAFGVFGSSVASVGFWRLWLVCSFLAFVAFVAFWLLSSSVLWLSASLACADFLPDRAIGVLTSSMGRGVCVRCTGPECWCRCTVLLPMIFCYLGSMLA